MNQFIMAGVNWRWYRHFLTRHGILTRSYFVRQTLKYYRRPFPQMHTYYFQSILPDLLLLYLLIMMYYLEGSTGLCSETI